MGGTDGGQQLNQQTGAAKWADEKQVRLSGLMRDGPYMCSLICVGVYGWCVQLLDAMRQRVVHRMQQVQLRVSQPSGNTGLAGIAPGGIVDTWFRGQPTSSASDAKITAWFRHKPAEVAGVAAEWLRGQPASNAKDAWFRHKPALFTI